MEQIIEVTISPTEEVVTAPEDNPRAGVARGDTVIWSFTIAGQPQAASVIEQKFRVRPKGSRSISAFDVPPSPVEGRPYQISARVSRAFEGDQIEYDIFKDGRELLWADREVTRINGGCMKPIIPPR